MNDDALLRSLRDHERDDPVPGQHLERIRDGLAAELGDAPPPAPSPAREPAMEPSSAAMLTTKFLGVGLVAIVAGGVGFALGRASSPPPPRAAVAPTERPQDARIEDRLVLHEAPPPTASGSSAPPREPPPEASASRGPVASAGATRAPATPGATAQASTDGDRDREASLLERARSALARRDSAGAGEALEACRREFPRGRHLEERDYLHLLLLRQRGDAAEAKAAADAFVTRYPNGLFRTRVEAMR